MKNRQFYKFVLPSIGAMLVTGLYFVVDGIFVGRGVGTGALAAINISVPFISILTSVSMMITMGGATITSINIGRGNTEKANHAFRLSLMMVLLFSLFMTGISLLFSEDLARLLGASDLLVKDTAVYIKNYVVFGIFFCGSMTLSAFVRNDNSPRLAFWGMIVGATSNVFLDWLFIYPLAMGIKGAAIASGLGQVLACLVLSIHFIRKRGILTLGAPRNSKDMAMQIIKTGTPEFVTQMSLPVTIFCYNLVILKLFGEIGVSAFSVISYILEIVIGVFTGLAQGIQPLLSQSFGEEDKESEKYIFKKGLRLNILLAAVMYVIMRLFGKEIISIFNHDTALISLAYACIKIYGINFVFAAANIVYTIYYLSTKRTKEAMVIAVLRSFIVNTIFIFLMPGLFGAKAVWTGLIVGEGLVLLVAQIISRYNKRETT